MKDTVRKTSLFHKLGKVLHLAKEAAMEMRNKGVWWEG
jgi:hypothetical protein